MFIGYLGLLNCSSNPKTAQDVPANPRYPTPIRQAKPVPIIHRYTITALVLRLYTTYEAADIPYYIYVRTAYLDDGTATARGEQALYRPAPIPFWRGGGCACTGC